MDTCAHSALVHGKQEAKLSLG